MKLPPYHPDTPEVRRDWAQYYDRITMMDKKAGKLLQELEKSGMADDTIVFYYSDHGSGMPRSKHWFGIRAIGSAEAVRQRPPVLASVVIGSKAAVSRVRLVRFVL